MTPDLHINERVIAIRTLVDVMTGLSGPPPLVLPSPPKMGNDSAQLARDSAASAVAIAKAAAALGTDDDDQGHATVLWDETLKQMARIQQLFNLTPYPFQNQKLPEPPEGS